MARIVNYHCTALTGGGDGALDAIDGNQLEDGYRAYVIIAATQTFYVYILDADSGAGDNGTTVIAPDTNPGAKRWLKCS